MALVLIPAARPFSQPLSSAALSGFLKEDPSEVHFTLLFVLDLDLLLQTGLPQSETIVQPRCCQWFRISAAFRAKVGFSCWAPACQWDICSTCCTEVTEKEGLGEREECHRNSTTAVLQLLPIRNPLKFSSILGKNSHLHQQIQKLQYYASNQTSLLIFFN